MEPGIVQYINESFAVSIPADCAQEQLEGLLAERINQLIIHDFTALVNILYRIDVSEKKLNTVLEQNKNTNAGKIIAVLIIERQQQKQRSRQQSRDEDNIIDEEERW